MNVLTYQNVEEKIITLRNQPIIVDSDVAELYGVETKRINEAVSRNTDKFPEGYLIQVTESEKNELVANCDRFNSLKHSTTLGELIEALISLNKLYIYSTMYYNTMYY